MLSEWTINRFRIWRVIMTQQNYHRFIDQSVIYVYLLLIVGLLADETPKAQYSFGVMIFLVTVSILPPPPPWCMIFATSLWLQPSHDNAALIMGCDYHTWHPWWLIIVHCAYCDMCKFKGILRVDLFKFSINLTKTILLFSDSIAVIQIYKNIFIPCIYIIICDLLIYYFNW